MNDMYNVCIIHICMGCNKHMICTWQFCAVWHHSSFIESCFASLAATDPDLWLMLSKVAEGRGMLCSVLIETTSWHPVVWFSMILRRQTFYSKVFCFGIRGFRQSENFVFLEGVYTSAFLPTKREDEVIGTLPATCRPVGGRRCFLLAQRPKQLHIESTWDACRIVRVYVYRLLYSACLFTLGTTASKTQSTFNCKKKALEIGTPWFFFWTLRARNNSCASDQCRLDLKQIPKQFVQTLQSTRHMVWANASERVLDQT